MNIASVQGITSSSNLSIPRVLPYHIGYFVGPENGFRAYFEDFKK